MGPTSSSHKEENCPPPSSRYLSSTLTKVHPSSFTSHKPVCPHLGLSPELMHFIAAISSVLFHSNIISSISVYVKLLSNGCFYGDILKWCFVPTWHNVTLSLWYITQDQCCLKWLFWTNSPCLFVLAFLWWWSDLRWIISLLPLQLKNTC